MKILTRSNLTVSFLVVIFLVIGDPASSFAGKAVKSARGYWNFDGIVEVVSHQDDILKIQVIVNNFSTDNSYKSGQFSKGMASCIVDWEVWHPDFGKVGSGQTSFQDICNGKSDRIFESFRVPAKYATLEVRFNITTPNGGHSFKKGRTNWN